MVLGWLLPKRGPKVIIDFGTGEITNEVMADLADVCDACAKSLRETAKHERV